MTALTHLDPRPPASSPQPGDVAQALTGKRHISYSQINTWRNCPQRYWFEYVTHAVPDFVGASLVFGGAVHAALEAYYQAGMEGETLGADDLLEVYCERFALQVEQPLPIRFPQDEDAGTLEATARRILDAFVESPHARVEGQIIAVEETVRANLHRELPEVLARVDLAARPTTRSSSSTSRPADADGTRAKPLSAGISCCSTPSWASSTTSC